MIAVALLSLLVGFSGAVMPGPLLATTLNQALVAGWTAGWWLAFGHMLAELALVGALRLGLGALLKQPCVIRAISLVGGGVLLYFAWGMVSAAVGGHFGMQAARMPALSVSRLIGQGVVLSIGNPYWHLWWATAGIGLIGSQVGKYGQRAWPAFFIGHTLADVIWFTGVSAALAFGGAFLSQSVHQLLALAFGIGMACLGGAFVVNPVLGCLRRR